MGIATNSHLLWTIPQEKVKNPSPNDQPADPTCASGRRSLIAVGELSNRSVQFLLLQPAEGSIQWWIQHFPEVGAPTLQGVPI